VASDHKLPSIRTVASLARVSTATVSNVLNARRSVAPELAARVQSAVEELGYIADLGASRLRSRKSAIAGALVPDIGNPFFGAFLATLESAARREGFDLLIVSSGGDPGQETARLRALLTWRPAGVIVIPCDDSFPAYEVASAAGVPVVAADRMPGDTPVDLVSVDNCEVARRVTEHLLAGGRRRILAVASHLAIANMRERCDGIRDAVAAMGGSALVEVLEAGLTFGEMRAHIAARLAAQPCPDAVFALNNVGTLAAVDALAAAGLSMPRDIALAGFDDDIWMHVVSPPITAVCQPVEEIAMAAWTRLMARIGGDESPPRQVRLACTVALRGSSGAAPGHPAFRQPADSLAVC
jgi:LacI family transcriptional regulator